MADLDFSDLSGNKPLLAAVEYLRMLPQWKEKPGKLRTGYCEFAEHISKHLLMIYCKLEGKTFDEKMELDDLANPIIAEKAAAFALADRDASARAFVEKLNAWHLDLAIVQKGMEHVLIAADIQDEGVDCVASVLRDRLSYLVESCPFPGSQGAAPTTP